MPSLNKLPIFKTAYDVLAYVLQLKKHPSIEHIYFDKNKVHYRRTKWGFEKAEKYNLNLALKHKEQQFDRLQQDYDNLSNEYELLLKRKTGLNHHLETANDKLRESKKEKGFFKKHLKEVLDKNTSLEKRMERMLKQEENLKQQVEKLKSSKENLFEQNQHLTEKSRMQRNQINAFHKTIEQLKAKQKENFITNQ
ncbi:hypothetical protein [Carboxylicivirga marina]|uniref:Uncharacterized protein n=1 Tax=Carboxylicivirga marina TaxID=2800988 RepID=A0ABS1HHS9_9BACT|nr:hypothetical protein [Carboxylicivirga marina]MBK3517232.1 hypothetical protein [Carboxylicivirga marina]